jgi:hypothetical protein
MSKFIQRLATGYGLSINAGEEASRFGVHAVDVDHVFLALVIDEGTAGQVLRRAGITLAAAREAVASRHREDLERLGVQAELPGDGRIRFLEQGGIEWTDRALDLVSRAGGKHRSGDATAVLRDVLGEPSGTVEDVLARLGTTPDDLLRHLDDAAGIRERAVDPARLLGRTHRVFVPAPTGDVWALVSDAARLPEWDPTLASVTDEAGIGVGASITSGADGRPLKVSPGTERQIVERITAADHRVEWLFSYPDAPSANRRSVVVTLEEAAGGSQVTVDFAWIRGAGPRGFRRVIAPVTRILARPIVRIALWFQVVNLAGGISRALR